MAHTHRETASNVESDVDTIFPPPICSVSPEFPSSDFHLTVTKCAGMGEQKREKRCGKKISGPFWVKNTIDNVDRRPTTPTIHITYPSISSSSNRLTPHNSSWTYIRNNSSDDDKKKATTTRKESNIIHPS